MSKSLGNVIDPREVLGKYGADAFRFFAAGSKLGDDLPYQEKDLLTGQKFITKLWNAAKFGMMHLEDYQLNNSTKSALKLSETFDRWLISKLQKLIKVSTETFESYEYSRTKSEVEKFFWHTFCDHYLEIVKDRLYNPSIRGAKARESAQEGIYHGLLTIQKLMAPIMPHITEEIYSLYSAEKESFKEEEKKNGKDEKKSSEQEKKKSIHTALWPVFNENLVDESAELAGDIGVDIINTVRKFKSEQKMSMKDELNELILVSDEKGFIEMIKRIEDDLRVVLKVKTIQFSGKTTLETEKFNVQLGIVQ